MRFCTHVLWFPAPLLRRGSGFLTKWNIAIEIFNVNLDDGFFISIEAESASDAIRIATQTRKDKNDPYNIIFMVKGKKKLYKTYTNPDDAFYDFSNIIGSCMLIRKENNKGIIITQKKI